MAERVEAGIYWPPFVLRADIASPLIDFDPLGDMLGAVANVSYKAMSMPFLMVSSIILILLFLLSSYLA
jgi:hypothetical protein